MSEELIFLDRHEFRRWLNRNHTISKGVWLVFSKSSGLKTLRPGEALEEALCFGWIDGQIKSLGEEKYLKRFTPRTRSSKWSAVNRSLAGRLMESGRMTEHGLATIEAARSRGAWDVPGREQIAADQIEALTKALQGADLALANFLKMPLSVRKTYAAFYLDARKEETRVRRLKRIIERLEANKRPM